MAIICQEHKLLFIMVPGTGCSVVGRALQEKLGGSFLPEQSISRNGHRVQRKHNTVPELIEHGLLSKEEREEYCVFASVRNPFDRWVTYYQRYEGEWIDYYEGVSRRQIERDREKFDLSGEEIERRVRRLEVELRQQRWRQKVVRASGFNTWMIGTLIRWALDGEKGRTGDISRYAFPMLDGVDVAIRQESLGDGLNCLLRKKDVDCRVDLPHKNTTEGKKHYTKYYSWPTRSIAEYLLGGEMDVLGYEFEGPIDDSSLVYLSHRG
jgi:hypothetical protein